MRIPILFGLILLTFSAPLRAEPEVVELIPPERAAWSPRNIVVGISSFLGAWNYWYGEREFLIETVPAEAEVGLYYIRSNFQKRFVRAKTPVRVKLPPRVHTTTRDSVKIRAVANGYSAKDVGYQSRKVPEAILIQMQPLPNSLLFLGHTDLAGRTTLTMRLTEEPELRVSKSSRFTGFTLALAETANKLEGEPKVSGGHVKGVQVAQVGEDVLIRVETDSPDVEARSKNGYDRIREEHIFSIDLMNSDARLPSDAEIRAQLESVRFSIGDSCLSAAADVLRNQLDPALLARSFRPSGDLADLYRREAMKRLGRLARGTVNLRSGETLRTGSPIELELALQSAADVRGYLELLLAFASAQSDPPTALRSLLAPELGSTAFEPIWSELSAARARCR